MKVFLLPLAAAVAMICASCATQAKTMPSAADLDRTHQRFLTLAQPQFDELERKRASGTLSQEDYEREKSALEYRVHQQAVDAAWTAHALAESDRKATGIPTPDSPQQIQVGNISGSLYQSHNDTYGSQGAMGATGQGYQPGSSIIGNSGRSF
jgi:hypothetical protein